MTEHDTAEIAFDATFVKRISKALTFSEVVDELSVNLIEHDLVTPDYPAAVKAREVEFPTGLPTEPIGVAIPHTDPKYVRQNAISVAVLKKPIQMTVMGTEDEKVDVSMVFLLSLGQSNKQLNILAKIMKIVQDQDALNKIMEASPEDIVTVVRNSILEDKK